MEQINLEKLMPIEVFSVITDLEKRIIAVEELRRGVNLQQIKAKAKPLKDERLRIISYIKETMGLDSSNDVFEYLDGEVKSHWDSFCSEGVVFSYIKEDKQQIFETVSLYGRSVGWYGDFEKVVLARSQEDKRFSFFNEGLYNSLRICKDGNSKFQKTTLKGIVRANEEIDRREYVGEAKNLNNSWYDYNELGAIYKHHGLNEIFETIAHFKLLEAFNGKDSVIIAKSFNRKKMVEITENDILAMEYLDKSSYSVDGSGNSFNFAESISLPKKVLPRNKKYITML